LPLTSNFSSIFVLAEGSWTVYDLQLFSAQEGERIRHIQCQKLTPKTAAIGAVGLETQSPDQVVSISLAAESTAHKIVAVGVVASGPQSVSQVGSALAASENVAVVGAVASEPRPSSLNSSTLSLSDSVPYSQAPSNHNRKSLHSS
jgi:hypothetical protein